MTKNINLIKKAIEAAKNQDWKSALKINSEFLEANPKNLGALNRLGLAYVKLTKPTKAKQTFAKVIELDKSNLIANKHLKNLKEKKGVGATAFSNTYFIEEPGKTKIVYLHRLCRKDALKKLGTGQPCQLVLKNKHVSIETDSGEYVGTLPDDLSYRLSHLIKQGNEYSCLIHSTTEKSCSVHLRETKTSSKNKNLQSFPTGKNGSLSNSKTVVPAMDKEFVLEKKIPVETGENENENIEEKVEHTLKKIHKSL